MICTDTLIGKQSSCSFFLIIKHTPYGTLDKNVSKACTRWKLSDLPRNECKLEPQSCNVSFLISKAHIGAEEDRTITMCSEGTPSSNNPVYIIASPLQEVTQLANHSLFPFHLRLEPLDTPTLKKRRKPDGNSSAAYTASLCQLHKRLQILRAAGSWGGGRGY